MLIRDKFAEITRFRPLLDQDPGFVERITSNCRVLIIEGISGSGKDTFQKYLKSKLRGRDVHDYSEGELLQSWNQLQIRGIFELRVKFMRLFVNYVEDILNRDENAVFLLNRFQLSAYAMTITQQPKLEREYDEIINVLRTLPVHVFILQLDENEIEKRSLHPERSAAWQKFQQQIVEKEGFRDRVERYVWQQRLMLEAAERQEISYSVIKLPSTPDIGAGWVRVSETRNTIRRGVRMNAADAKISRKKRDLPQTL
jgi:thymidylate kinase